jgi:hypothetical protein
VETAEPVKEEEEWADLFTALWRSDEKIEGRAIAPQKLYIFVSQRNLRTIWTLSESRRTQFISDLQYRAQKIESERACVPFRAAKEKEMRLEWFSAEDPRQDISVDLD